MSTAKRKFERTHTIADARKNLKCKAKQIKWIGDREDLGLVKGKTYTYKQLGAAVGIVSHSMRGRLRGSSEASDYHMWANGEKKPREEWGTHIIVRCESEADKLSQKYLRMSL